ncbi:MAG: hypothetical protein AAFV33_05420, partial [Chloroflexota bacterium]
MRFIAMILLLLTASVPALAQNATPAPVFSINNAFYTLAGDEAALLEGCATPATETVDSSIALAPSGAQLAVITRVNSAEVFLTTCDLAAGTQSFLERPNFLTGIVTAPVYSPAGTQIAVSYIDTEGNGTITTVDAAILGGRVWASDVTISEGDVVNPVLWTPDSEILTFTSTFDNFDSTYEEIALGYSEPRAINRQQQLSRSFTDRIIEQFIIDGQLISLYISGAIYVTDLESGDTQIVEDTQLITDTAPLQLTFTPSTSLRGGIVREWTVVDADGNETTLAFAGTTAQIALSPDGEQVLYVADDAVYLWADGEAVPVPGTEITNSDAVTSVAWE